MSCQCYVTFDLAFVLVLTFEHQSLGLACQGLGLGLGLELLSLESKPGDYRHQRIFKIGPCLMKL